MVGGEFGFGLIGVADVVADDDDVVDDDVVDDVDDSGTRGLLDRGVSVFPPLAVARPSSGRRRRCCCGWCDHRRCGSSRRNSNDDDDDGAMENRS